MFGIEDEEWEIISYQNLEENYNLYRVVISSPFIISYQNLEENYNIRT